MTKNNPMLDDIYENHQERILNLMKYLPFFKLQETSFHQYKEGRYDGLDMGYIVMGVLRFFLEENNFNDRRVTYGDYLQFVTGLLRRDFNLFIPPEEEKELAGYIFDKIKNDGRPFTMDYFDPVEKKTKTARMKLIDSTLKDGVMYYDITADAIEFYLETKEVKEGSRINIKQLLLEKMIETKNFSGGLDVVRQINSEVNKLRMRKQEVIKTLGINVYEGVKALEEFNRTGIRWFEEEQSAFQKNRELIARAKEKAEESQTDEGAYKMAYEEIFLLENELLKAISNHGKLLSDCMELQVKADEIIHKYKFSRLKNAFDFKGYLEKARKFNDVSLLGNLIRPLQKMKTKQSFYIGQIDDLLTQTVKEEEEGEKLKEEEVVMYRFEDEEEEERIGENYTAIIKTLFDTLLVRERFDLQEFNEILELKYFDNIFRNSDYYSFLVHICQKKEYDLSEVKKHQDTFFEGIVSEMLKDAKNIRYLNLRFQLELLGDMEETMLDFEEHETERISHVITGVDQDTEFMTSNIRFIRY